MNDPAAISGQEKQTPLRFLPLGVFALLAALFLVRLFAGDASRIPSALIGKPAPAFALPPLGGLRDVPGLASEDLRQGHVSIVNVFASWCGPCRAEHKSLMALANDEALQAKSVRLYGLSYKDEPSNAVKFLEEVGNPFARVGLDKAGRVVIPKTLRDELHLEAGDSLELISDGDRMTLRPVRSGSALRKEQGVWVFRRGDNTISAESTTQALEAVRSERDRVNRAPRG